MVIKNADKGSDIVVEDRESYIEPTCLMNTFYNKIDHDPTTMLAKASNTFTNIMYNKGVVDSITSSFQMIRRTQQMYFLKKIHLAVRPGVVALPRKYPDW